MRTMIGAIVLLALAAPVLGQAEGVSRTNGSAFPPSLAGRWQSAPFELSLSSDFHVSVYGRNARSTRSVSLTLQPSGQGVFTVTTSVRDGRGRVVPGTREIQEVTFTIGDLVEEPGRQPHYVARVSKAERRFADEPSSAFPRDGVKLAIYTLETPGSIEIRFDTPEGTGSFWETLRRGAARSQRSRS